MENFILQTRKYSEKKEKFVFVTVSEISINSFNDRK
jgi:hypothetical protein